MVKRFAELLKGIAVNYSSESNFVCSLFLLTPPLLFCFDKFSADEFKAFLKRLPTDRFLNVSTVAKFWSADLTLQKRYVQLESSTALVLAKAQKIVRKLFTLSKRCPKQPRISLPRER